MNVLLELWDALKTVLGIVWVGFVIVGAVVIVATFVRVVFAVAWWLW